MRTKHCQGTEEDGQAGDGGEGHIAQDSAKANPTAKGESEQ